MAATAPSPAQYDAAVIGAGVAGLATAVGLARAGLKVACVGRPERPAPGRTVALFGGSMDFLASLGFREAIEAAGAPLRVLRIVDDTGSLFAPAPVEFRAVEIGRDAFGYNVENAALVALLSAAPAGVTRFETDAAGFEFGTDVADIALADGDRIAARLVIGADGRQSPSRRAAGVEIRERRFEQMALTLILRHSRSHGDASTEFHTREGPFTLVPLPGVEGAPHRSSLVWLMRQPSFERRRAMPDAELAREIRKGSRAMLGEVAIEGGRGAFPMTLRRVSSLTAPRLALVGDAAHSFPPIGAQGLNLGLRDVREIVTAAQRARDLGRDVGGAATLDAYETARRGDVAMRTLGVGALNVSLLLPYTPVDALRGLALGALGRLAPLRRAAMREGLRPFLAP